jgi:hypothetical protein
VNRVSTTDCLFSRSGVLAEASALEFWQWAFSDLRQNDLRGVFAEWLVAQLLGLKLDETRDSWAAHDLISLSGLRIEVKAAAYHQAWHKLDDRPSKILFRGLRGRILLSDNTYAELRTFNLAYPVVAQARNMLISGDF